MQGAGERLCNDKQARDARRGEGTTRMLRGASKDLYVATYAHGPGSDELFGGRGSSQYVM